MRLEAALALKFQGESLTPEADENLKQEVEQLNFIIKANCGQNCPGPSIATENCNTICCPGKTKS